MNFNLSKNELSQLIDLPYTSEDVQQLRTKADSLRQQFYGKEVYIRGLIEFTNFCKNDCYYCGIRAANRQAQRYRLTPQDILNCCQEGYTLGFRTFVLQGGEDLYYSELDICHIVASIKERFPDCAVTLSIGEKSKASYQSYFSAGADRYLLRHETADNSHYRQLHPQSLSLENRKRCLYALKEIGYQVGSGFMVGSPYQTTANLISDLLFLEDLQPDMIGIGPFIHHPQTPLGKFPDGTLELTLKLISILRLLFPYALIPATTALGTIHPQGRELGLQAGANVVMPNLSPKHVRQLYQLYSNKKCTGAEAAQGLEELKQRVLSVGYEIVTSRGDAKTFNKGAK